MISRDNYSKERTRRRAVDKLFGCSLYLSTCVIWWAW